MAALFIKHFPRESAGVFTPETMPVEKQQAILKDVRSRGIRLAFNVTRREIPEEDQA